MLKPNVERWDCLICLSTSTKHASMYNKQYPGYITMTIVTGNETFPELNITKENLVEDQLPVLVNFWSKYTYKVYKFLSSLQLQSQKTIKIHESKKQICSWRVFHKNINAAQNLNGFISQTINTILNLSFLLSTKYGRKWFDFEIVLQVNLIKLNLYYLKQNYFLLYFLITRLLPNSNFKLELKEFWRSVQSKVMLAILKEVSVWKLFPFFLSKICFIISFNCRTPQEACWARWSWPSSLASLPLSPSSATSWSWSPSRWTNSSRQSPTTFCSGVFVSSLYLTETLICLPTGSLAIADFIIGAYSIPFFTIQLIENGRWPLRFSQSWISEKREITFLSVGSSATSGSRSTTWRAMQVWWTSWPYPSTGGRIFCQVQIQIYPIPQHCPSP